MNTPLPGWAATLSGVQTGGPHELHFGDVRAETAAALGSSVVVPLTHLAVLHATGADAGAFLQGQLSNDVTRVTQQRAQLSSCNSPKGRMLAVINLHTDDAETMLLELHASVLPSVLGRLRMYVLRAKVTLAEITEHALIGLSGPDAPELLSGLQLPVPAGVMECAWQDAVCIQRRHGDLPRYSLRLPAAQAPELWLKLADRFMPAGTAAWRLLDILAGLPTIYPVTQDHFVPQMCNLDTLGGISFDKGCYTGQEIVARVHYRGAVKRRMQTVRRPEHALEPGAKMTLDDGSAAEVVDAAPHPDGGSLALAVGPA
jgi:tRNA-modifying protein YgfZ